MVLSVTLISLEKSREWVQGPGPLFNITFISSSTLSQELLPKEHSKVAMGTFCNFFFFYLFPHLLQRLDGRGSLISYIPAARSEARVENLGTDVEKYAAA